MIWTAGSTRHEGLIEARLLHAELALAYDPPRRAALEALLVSATLTQALADRARAALGPG